jgi:hypothetical protein
MDKPTFQPSILHSGRDVRCHSYVREGKIEFCNDSTHKFAGQTLEIPDWDPGAKEQEQMKEKQILGPGDQVKLLAPHVSGITAVVVLALEDSIVIGNESAVMKPNTGGYVCRITSSQHPSGHSQEGTLVMFSRAQLQGPEETETEAAQQAPAAPEVNL